MALFPLRGKVVIEIDVNESSQEGIDFQDARENYLEWLHEMLTGMMCVDAEIREVDIW